MFVLHPTFHRSSDPTGYLLLRVIHSYIEVDMYISLDVHTEKTIDAGREAVKKFYDLLDVSFSSTTSALSLLTELEIYQVQSRNTATSV